MLTSGGQERRFLSGVVWPAESGLAPIVLFCLSFPRRHYTKMRLSWQPFQKRAAIRIAAVSVVLASIASPGAWFVARERAEEEHRLAGQRRIGGRLFHHYDAIDLNGPTAAEHAVLAKPRPFPAACSTSPKSTTAPGQAR